MKSEIEMMHLKKCKRYFEVFTSEQGKEVLNDIIALCGVNAMTTYRADGNVNDMIFLEGRRNIGNYILSLINWYEDYLNGKQQ